MLNSVHFIKYRLGLAPAMTQTTETERGVLRTHATGKQRLVEVGVYHGVNTRMFREVMDADGVLIAIDPFDRSLFGIRGYGWARRIAHAEVGRSTNGRVVWVECFGKDAPRREDVCPLLPVDFIFIDGDHSYEGLQGDWTAWKDLVDPGGIVALHDSDNRNLCGSERYTKSVILHDPAFEKVELVDSLTILRKRPVACETSG